MKFTTNSIKAISSVSFMMFSLIGFSQEGENLVPNPSFESTEKKVKRLGAIANATGWTSPTGVRSDLFVPSKIEDVNVPFNAYGKEDAKDGVNYAGIVTYSHGGKMPRTYVMTKMDAPMKKGLKYCVKFYVSLSEASKYATNNVGAKFSKKPFGTDQKVSIIDEPSLMHFDNDQKIMSARFNWTEICGVYQAKGGEKYITLGNFLSDEETKSERMKKSKDVQTSIIAAAYYYVDNISVQLLDADKGEQCECETEDVGEAFSTTIYQKSFMITEEMTTKDKVELQQVYFAFGKDKMNSQGTSSLDFIAGQMKANPEMKLQIMGHNNAKEDEVGAEKDIYADMDNKRIGAVMKYLIEKGIAESRLLPAPKGSDVSSPDAVESDDEDLRMAKDRRVTFKVR